MLFYLPYKQGSGSVRNLQKSIGGKRILHEGNYTFKPYHLICNWGYGGVPYWGHYIPVGNSRVLNHWSKIAAAINKLDTFKVFKEMDVSCPPWTASKETALSWIKKGRAVFCRKLLTAKEGAGIVIADSPEKLVGAPLYTKLINKHKEYRVHVFQGKIIDFTQKKLKVGEAEKEGHNQFIRNTANGWIMAREGVVLPDNVAAEALKAVTALKLDFGAVDLCTNKAGKVFVFEVNTAPGIEGTTLEKYSKAITNWSAVHAKAG